MEQDEEKEKENDKVKKEKKNKKKDKLKESEDTPKAKKTTKQELKSNINARDFIINTSALNNMLCTISIVI